MKRLVYWIALLLALSLILILGYRKVTERPAVSSSTADADSKIESTLLEPATLQLKWIYNAGFAGDLVAREKDLWKPLAVTVRPGGPSINPIQSVLSGEAQFGVATGDQILLAAEQGSPLVAIALAYQQNPLAWITHADAGIREPRDLKGKKVGLSYIDDVALFEALLAFAGLNSARDVNVVRVQFDQSPFLRREVDAFPVYRNTQAVDLAVQLGEGKTSLVGPADAGIVSYSNLYFTSREFLRDHPVAVRQFVAGVRAGWEYSCLNPQETAQIVKKNSPESTLDVLQKSVVATCDLVRPTPDTQIGRMTLQGWKSTQEVLLKSGQLKKAVPLEPIFTNDFI